MKLREGDVVRGVSMSGDTRSFFSVVKSRDINDPRGPTGKGEDAYADCNECEAKVVDEKGKLLCGDDCHRLIGDGYHFRYAFFLVDTPRSGS